MPLVLIVILFSIELREPSSHRLIVWNVGQGLWVTAVDFKQCLHFDMGGEKWPHPVLEFCRKKDNQLVISHFDWDHISMIRQFDRNVVRLCSHQKFHKLPRCHPHERIRFLQSRTHAKTRNGRSLVTIYDRQILLPGDSLKKQERIWSTHLEPGIRALVLGHHGSNTSTGRILLKQIRQLKFAIASARQSRYGHPHSKVIKRLSEKKCGSSFYGKLGPYLD